MNGAAILAWVGDAHEIMLRPTETHRPATTLGGSVFLPLILMISLFLFLLQLVRMSKGLLAVQELENPAKI